MTGKSRARDSKSSTGCATREANAIPLLVRLAKGTLAKRTSDDLALILRNLQFDDGLLDKSRAIEQLLFYRSRVFIKCGLVYTVRISTKKAFVKPHRFVFSAIRVLL